MSSNAPYVAFTSLSDLAESVRIGNLVEYDAWAEQWASFSPAVTATTPLVRQGFVHAPKHEMDAAVWQVAVLAWPLADDDLSRALVDFALRRLAELFESDRPDLAAALLRMPHRRLKADDTTAMTQLIMADLTPQKADEALARDVLRRLEGDEGQALDEEQRDGLTAAWKERLKKSLEPPPLPLPPVDPKKVVDDTADNRKLFIIGAIIAAFLILSLAQNFRF